MGTYIRPFADAIYRGYHKLDNHNEIKRLLIDLFSKIQLEGYDPFYATGYTSYNSNIDLTTYSEIDSLKNLILFQCKQFVLDQLEYVGISENSKRKIKLSEIWFNVNPPMAYQGRHHHADHLLAGTYYIQVPNNSGMIRFYNPNNFAIFKASNNKNEIIAFHVDTDPKEGELILWNGFMDHEVTTNLTNDQNRISISFCLDFEPL